MAEDDFFSQDGDEASARSGDVTIPELTWALIDQQISAGELELLETALLADPAARGEYLGCVQLHADLMAYFSPPTDEATAKKSPVLGFLGASLPSLETPQTN